MNLESEFYVAVIIPVYNAEEHLAQCIDSVLQQNYKDFELILIDDGSTDNSGSICKNYVRNHENIRYIRKDNGGVSIARNMGINVSKSKWVTFIDSDDFIDSNYLESLLTSVTSECELVTSGFKYYINGQVTQSFSQSDQANSSSSDFLQVVYNLDKARLFNGPCCKLFRSDLLNNYGIRFKEGVSVSEDMIFSLQYVSICKHIVNINYCGYNYRMNWHESLSKRIFDYHFYEDAINTIYSLRLKLLADKNLPDYKSFIEEEKLFSLIWAYPALCKRKMSYRIKAINSFLVDETLQNISYNTTSNLFLRVFTIFCKLRSALLVDVLLRLKLVQKKVTLI